MYDVSHGSDVGGYASLATCPYKLTLSDDPIGRNLRVVKRKI